MTGKDQDDAMADDNNLASKAGHLHGSIKNINIRRTDTNDVLTLTKDHPDIQDWNVSSILTFNIPSLEGSC